MARIRLNNADPVSVPGFKRCKVYKRSKAGKPTNGNVGTYTYKFQIYHDQSKTYSKPTIVKFDTFQQAREYVIRNTPVGYQGLLDGESIFVN